MKLTHGLFLAICCVPFFGAGAVASNLLTVDKVVSNSQANAVNGVPSTTTWIPKSHKLLYTVQSGSISKIVTYDTDRHSMHVLTNGLFPVPAPDGQHYVFLRPKATTDAVTITEHGATTEILLGDYNGGLPILLTTLDGVGPSWFEGLGGITWSPDSKRLAYKIMIPPPPSNPWHFSGDAKVYVYPDDIAAVRNKRSFTITFHVFDVSAKTDRIVARQHGEAGAMLWLDNNTVLYEHDNAKDFDHEWSSLSEFGMDGKTRTLVSGYHRQTAYIPVLSPKGDKIALSVNPEPVITYPERDELGVADVRTGKVRVLTHNSNVRSFAWASDDAIVYTDGSSTRRQIFKQTLDGKPRIALTASTGFKEGASISGDGRAIAWISTAPNGTMSFDVGDLKPTHVTRIRRLAVLVNPTQGIISGVTRPYAWKSTDGLALDGYLTLPVGYKSGQRYPLIVIIHGGPTGLVKGSVPDEWPGQMSFLEYFAQRGYAVFVPDYRSSGNFGFDKIEEDRHHHRAMQSDFADLMSGVDSLERAGIADPQREAVLGHSYGGLEVNWLITQTHHFRTAISYDAGTDWYYEWGTIYGPNSYSNWKLMGPPTTEPDVYSRNSSITYAGNIRTPTMFVNAEDGIDPPSSTWLYAASLSNHVAAKFVLYPGEPHIIQKPENERDLFLRIVRWIDGHLTP